MLCHAVEKLKAGIPLEQARLIVGALTVGDAGGAVILGPSDTNSETGFGYFHQRTRSEHYELCTYKMTGGDAVGQMNMAKITQAIFANHREMIHSTLKEYGWHEFDRGICHQTSAIQFKRIANLKGLGQEKMVKTFPKLGNIATASFPVSFHQLVTNEKLVSGARIGCFFSGSGITIGQFGYTY